MNQQPSFLLPKSQPTPKATKATKANTKQVKVEIINSKPVGSGIKVYAREKLMSDIEILNKKIAKQQNIVDNYDEFLETSKLDLKVLKEKKDQLEKLTVEF